MKQRYTKREPVQSTCILSCEGMMGQGQLLNLSVPGCLLKTSMKLKVGQYVDLRLSFPTSATALQVKLAAVRWAKNGQVGLVSGLSAWAPPRDSQLEPDQHPPREWSPL